MLFLKKLARLLIGLTLIVVVHEMGHAFAAKLCGVETQKFGIGFGPGYAIHNVPVVNELVLSPILLGGYVELDEDVLATQSAPKKLFIFMAGMLANALLGFIIFAIVKKKLSAAFLLSFANWLMFPLMLVWILLSRRKKNVEVSVEGPVQIIKMLASSKKPFSLAVAEFSVGVAMLNLLPLFPLDGGKMAEVFMENIFEGKILDITLLTFRMFGAIALFFLCFFLILMRCFKSNKAAKAGSRENK